MIELLNSNLGRAQGPHGQAIICRICRVLGDRSCEFELNFSAPIRGAFVEELLADGPVEFVQAHCLNASFDLVMPTPATF
jgi:hypothetical protein